MHKIVIPVRGDGKGDNVFVHASALARRFQAHIVVTHCRPRAEDMMPFGVPIPAAMKKLLLTQSKEVADQVEDGLRQEVEKLAQANGITITDGVSSSGATASWVEQQGRQVDIIKTHGRLADIICVAKPDVDRNLGTNTLKTALFHTGRPVMMCPEPATPPENLCEKISIAWNGSLESTRAVAMTMDIIEDASEVTILASAAEIHGASADGLSEYLAQRGIKSSVERFAESKKVGQHLLENSKELGKDTLIMGAYGDSHEHETIFGGNTQYVVDHAEMPVILVH